VHDAAQNIEDIAKDDWGGGINVFANHFEAARYEAVWGKAAHDAKIRELDPNSSFNGESHLSEFSGCSGLKLKLERLMKAIQVCTLRQQHVPQGCIDAARKGEKVVGNICVPLGL
jgi:hypothetical protein